MVTNIYRHNAADYGSSHIMRFQRCVDSDSPGFFHFSFQHGKTGPPRVDAGPDVCVDRSTRLAPTLTGGTVSQRLSCLCSLSRPAVQPCLASCPVANPEAHGPFTNATQREETERAMSARMPCVADVARRHRVAAPDFSHSTRVWLRPAGSALPLSSEAAQATPLPPGADKGNKGHSKQPASEPKTHEASCPSVLRLGTAQLSRFRV